jgi:hypothetical protein
MDRQIGQHMDDALSDYVGDQPQDDAPAEDDVKNRRNRRSQRRNALIGIDGKSRL